MRETRTDMKHQAGFSLIELAIALTVSSLLATMALPSYRAQKLRSHRADATQTLQRLQLAQEQYREAHGGYAGSLGLLPGNWSGQSPAGHYQIELTSTGPAAYEVRASAIGSQADDAECGTLSVRVEGALSFQEPGGRCWPT
jgi:type IV pilus assembly protein PilE